MEIKEEQKEQIINFGVFSYDAKKIASILDFNVDEVEKELSNIDSELNQLLQKGKDMSDYVIDLKLFEMAKSGDLKALDKLSQRKANRIRMQKSI